MTANQLITLLCIYRGGLDDAQAAGTGTLPEDLIMLERRGLIALYGTTEYMVTFNGVTYIKHLLLEKP